MERVRGYLNRLKRYFTAYPVRIIPLSIALTIVVFSMIECVRARMYISSLNNYNQSLKVLEMKDTATQLLYSIKITSAAANCDISIDNLPVESDYAFAAFFDETRQPHTLIKSLNDKVASITPAPSFNSMMQFLPKVSEARRKSLDKEEALKNLDKLTTKDIRSEYCVGLFDVFSNSYFIVDLQKPEAVSALLVGQIEDFQLELKNTQKMFNSLRVPKVFERQHIRLADLYEQIARHLQENTNNYTRFSRNLEKDCKVLKQIIKEISSLAPDLKKRTDDIALIIGEF